MAAVARVKALLDWLVGRLRPPGGAAHLRTGRAGEEAAYFHLRERGYVIVARNWRTPRLRGELDLVGWDGPTLCFIEVKTRHSREVAAELAVDRAKQRQLLAMARAYRRRYPPDTPIRFDVVSVYEGVPEGRRIELIKDAFTGRSMKMNSRNRSRYGW
jgi:putative endonuclease